MKNKYNIKQVADAYCLELGVDIPIIEDYLKAVFTGQKYDEIECSIIDFLKDKYDGLSEFFPDWK